VEPNLNEVVVQVVTHPQGQTIALLVMSLQSLAYKTRHFSCIIIIIIIIIMPLAATVSAARASEAVRFDQ